MANISDYQLIVLVIYQPPKHSELIKFAAFLSLQKKLSEAFCPISWCIIKKANFDKNMHNGINCQLQPWSIHIHHGICLIILKGQNDLSIIRLLFYSVCNIKQMLLATDWTAKIHKTSAVNDGYTFASESQNGITIIVQCSTYIIQLYIHFKFTSVLSNRNRANPARCT